MAEPRRTLTDRAALSNDRLKELTKESGNPWPDLLIEDYQGIIQDYILVADTLDGFDLRISTNADKIKINFDNIQTNTDNFATHNNSTSQHGVTGNNVGTEDFCTEVIGGVVKLMATVTNAVASTQEITLADLASAPAVYDQAYTQLAANLANDTKTKHNQLVVDLNSAITQINDLIAKSKIAKQMVV